MPNWIRIVKGMFSAATWMKEYRYLQLVQRYKVLEERCKELEFDNQMLQERVYDLEGLLAKKNA